MDFSHPLWNLRGEALGEYFESRVLSMLGWADAPPLEALANAYRQLSDALNASAGRGPSGHIRLSGAITEDHTLAVWLLIYGFRTVVVARRLLAAYPPPPGRLVEIGAGAGPFGLVAAAGGCDVELVDLDSQMLLASKALYSAFGLPPPATTRIDGAKAMGRGDALAVPYAAMECGEAMMTPLIKALRKRRVYLIERGTREGGRFVQELRDIVASSVVAPCPDRPGCSLKERPRDWCHFTWSLAPGPVTRALADRAARKWRELHVSYLVSGLGSNCEARVMQHRTEGRRKQLLEVCTPQGYERLVALSRHAEAFEVLANAESGAAITLQRDKMRSMGDGLRIEVPEALEVQIDGDPGLRFT